MMALTDSSCQVANTTAVSQQLIHKNFDQNDKNEEICSLNVNCDQGKINTENSFLHL